MLLKFIFNHDYQVLKSCQLQLQLQCDNAQTIKSLRDEQTVQLTYASFKTPQLF